MGVSVLDPAALAGPTAALIASAFVAVLVPAWRATNIDPVQTLRETA